MDTNSPELLDFETLDRSGYSNVLQQLFFLLQNTKRDFLDLWRAMFSMTCIQPIASSRAGSRARDFNHESHRSLPKFPAHI